MRYLAFLLALLLLTPVAAGAQPSSVDALARDVDRAESVRAVKNLQRLYAHYAQFGLWRDVAELFADDGSFVFDGKASTGKAAIAAFLRTRYGAGRDGIAEWDVRTMMIDGPVVSLSPDGESAKGRWQAIIFTGGRDSASIEGGVFENDYIRRRGVWTIATARYHPQYFGPYEAGWTNWGGGDLGLVPYHFTTDGAGTPIPPAVGAAPRSGSTTAGLQRRIDALNDEDQVRNLQSAYGYYADRRMWDDVTDLFAADAAVEIGGIGIYRGSAGVRRWLETIGPQGLQHGQLNDRPQFDVVVSILPGGREAFARGIELGMLGEADRQEGEWEVAVFRNRFVKEAGVWKIREMRRFPLFRADYFKGWGKSRIFAAVPRGAQTPDARTPFANLAEPDFTVPAFLGRHPVTGRPVAVPAPLEIVAAASLTGPIGRTQPSPVPLAALRQRLARSTAYDGIQNVSTAYGNYLDDFQSPQFGALMAEKGFKVFAFAGYYIGRDRIIAAGKRVWGEPPVTRPGISYHWRTQPVILVAADGRAANARFRLFQPRTGKQVGKPGDFYGAAFWGGIYHDQFVLGASRALCRCGSHSAFRRRQRRRGNHRDRHDRE